MFIATIRGDGAKPRVKVYIVSDNFDDAKKKFLELYGDRLVSIEWRNEEKIS